MNPTLDNLKKIAKRWLKALRTQDPDAQARLRRVHPHAPVNPGLRDVQHALAREHGHESWTELRRVLDQTQRTAQATPDLAQYESLAKDLLAAYHTGDSGALQRLQERFGRAVAWDALRDELDRDLGQLPQTEPPHDRLDLASVRLIIARAAGFESWSVLLDTLNVEASSADGTHPVVRLPPPQESGVSPGMMHPVELSVTLPMELQDGLYSTTTEVWKVLAASHAGNLAEVKVLVSGNPAFVRCEYNYMPPLHLAVREGHSDLVRYLLEQGAYDPGHVTYPYNETLLIIAEDRGYSEIAGLLREYGSRPRPAHAETKAVHGAGAITFPHDEERNRFEKLVGANALHAVEKLLQRRPELVRNEYVAWSEGILSGPANRRRRDLIELLMRYGARVPDVAKWGRAYYFKHYDIAAFLLERGMNPNHMNWQRTTLLHDMMWEGDMRKARLLLDHGADIHAIDDEFRSTPLGLAARWGRPDLVTLLLERGADPNRSGAPWATPLAWARKKGHAEIETDLRQAGAR